MFHLSLSAPAFKCKTQLLLYPLKLPATSQWCPINKQCTELVKTKIKSWYQEFGSTSLESYREIKPTTTLLPLKNFLAMQRERLSCFKYWDCGWGWLGNSFQACLPTLHPILLATDAITAGNMVCANCFGLGPSEEVPHPHYMQSSVFNVGH